MNSGSKMKRSSSERGTASRRAEEHDASNPFCAANPDLSEHSPSRNQLDPEEATPSFRRTNVGGLRAHVRADHVAVTKKRK